MDRQGSDCGVEAMRELTETWEEIEMKEPLFAKEFP